MLVCHLLLAVWEEGLRAPTSKSRYACYSASVVDLELGVLLVLSCRARPVHVVGAR
jgi:hypothetical protein